MQMYKSTYNGWTNYATWNTALWVDNEEYTYFTRIDEQKRIVEWTAALVESFVREVFPDGTPDMQDGVMMRDGLNAVNYEEIATHWNEE